MKNKFAILVSAMLISVSAFAQKDELKILKKIYDKDAPSEKDMADYKAAVATAETHLATATESEKVYINFYKGMTPILDVNNVMSKPGATPQQMLPYINADKISQMATALTDVLAYEKKSGKQVYTKDIEETITSFTPMLLQYAQALGTQKKYKDTAVVLYSIYQLDKKNQDNLYYAANYAVNAQDYDLALKYYDELKKLNYSGEGTIYYAKSKLTDKEDAFYNKTDLDNALKVTHEKPVREEKIPSKRGEIYKNIALILVQKGKIDEAKAAITEAKKENPDDSSLLVTEADLYLQLKDTAAYQRLIGEAIAKDPNNADLVYNMGVMSMQAEQLADAERYFTKAIAIDPKYVNAYLNLSAIKFKDDKKLVDEMNKLTTSEKDNKRYAALKAQRETLFKSTLPYLEKAHEFAPDNQDVIDNLLSVYNFLEMTDKYKALKTQKK
ncbi:MAG TPA: tetratricopeptide repeat protein [Flavobacterium sp.]|nr:tetratricopeptide repeat protein [Flavobacterium sp.]